MNRVPMSQGGEVGSKPTCAGFDSLGARQAVDCHLCNGRGSFPLLTPFGVFDWPCECKTRGRING